MHPAGGSEAICTLREAGVLLKIFAHSIFYGQKNFVIAADISRRMFRGYYKLCILILSYIKKKKEILWYTVCQTCSIR